MTHCKTRPAPVKKPIKLCSCAVLSLGIKFTGVKYVSVRCRGTIRRISFCITFDSRGNSPERGKGNFLLPVALCYHIRKFVPRSGCKSTIFGYVLKNVPVQEGINPSIYLI